MPSLAALSKLLLTFISPPFLKSKYASFFHVFLFSFRKKSGILETITNLWYRQPSDNLTEGEKDLIISYKGLPFILQRATVKRHAVEAFS